jgi:hypothetical protein
MTEWRGDMKTLSLGAASLFIILMAIYIAIGAERPVMLLVMAFFALVGLPGVAILAFEIAKGQHDDNR